MSGRYHDYGKGSSRSARDDSRHEERHGRERARSRSPRRRRSPDSKAPTRELSRSKEQKVEQYSKSTIKKSEWEDSDEEVPAPPPPPRISKITMGFSKPKVPIKMNIGGPSKAFAAAPKPTMSNVFSAEDDDDEPEEMPAEARMRMRNIGRETPTSAGPNSFGKTKQGFCDAKKVFEKNLKQALETVDKPAMPKFPQTIYKIKP